MKEEQNNGRDLKQMMSNHFEDDKKSFGRLNELLIVNGDHMSSFRRDISKIMDILAKQDEASLEHRKAMQDHMNRVEPMISSYEIDTVFSKALGDKGKKWGGYILGLASFIAAWYVIKEFLIKIILK